MFHTMKVVVSGFFYFLMITILKRKNIERLNEDEQILKSREILKELSQKILKVAKIEVEIEYKNKKEYESLLKKNKGIVIIANHQSNFDIPVLIQSLDLPIGFVAKKEMENWPFYSYWMKKSGCVFLDRKNNREGMKGIKKCIELVKDGFSMVIFPEGNRSETGEIGRFKKGSFKIPIDASADILPIAIDGTYEIQNKKSIMIKSGVKVKVIIGEIIKEKELNKNEKKDLNIKVENLIKKEIKLYKI